MNQFSLPARLSFEEAIITNLSNGHENEGSLSAEYGFLPTTPPMQNLLPSYQIWDATAARLPELFRELSLRSVVDEMPVLSATAKVLPDQFLLRAASLLGMLAHAYYRVESEPPARLPACLLQSWTEVSYRLGKSSPFLSYLDLIMYNWKKRKIDQPIILENLDLLIPTVGNEEERIFYLTQVEIAAEFAPAVTAVIRAQEAVLQHDNLALERELLLMLERLQHITEVSLQKIDPNPYSRTYVDQVVWAKSVAPFAVPINPQTPGPSGTAAPIFHLLDAFFSRTSFESVLGHEAQKLGSYFPPAWRKFIAAVGKVSVKSYVDSQPDPAIRGLFYQVLETYAGDKGYLGTHRLKVYGYLENAFKVGRAVTIGGFRGLFKNKTWQQVDGELSLARDERYQDHMIYYHKAKISPGGVLTGSGSLSLVELDVSNTGLRYRPGDRVGVLPHHSPALVNKTLRALGATGNEQIQLNRYWHSSISFLADKDTKVLPLQTFLEYAKIRPVTREVAKYLHQLTASKSLKVILDTRTEDQWELWDLLAVLQKEGFDPGRLWKAGPGELESICRIIPPETYRLYSIASSTQHSLGEEQGIATQKENYPSNLASQNLQLMVAELRYSTSSSPLSGEIEERYGSASHYLQRMLNSNPNSDKNIELKIVPAPRFHLPKDPACPVVMFASGSGIAPFSGFLTQRLAQSGENWLFFATRRPEELFYHRCFAPLLQAGKLELRVAFSASEQRLRFNGEQLVLEAGGKSGRLDQLMLEETNAQALWQLLRPSSEGGKGAFFYVCGSTSFARTIMDTLHTIIALHTSGIETEREETARRFFYRLVGQRRYQQDIFTTYNPMKIDKQLIDASELVRHNNPENGYWVALEGKVYDLTEFMNLHPGGNRILIGNAGIDATQAYQAVRHHLNPEIKAQLGLIEIGAIRRLDFSEVWATSLGSQGLFHFSLEEAFEKWVRCLYLVTEMENSIENDFSFLESEVTVGETPGKVTPLKLQFLIEAHERIYSNYLKGLLDEELAEVWQITLGLLSPDLGVHYWQETLKMVRTSEEFEIVRQASLLFKKRLKAGQIEKLATLGSLIIEEDKRVFHELKEVLRRGVGVFETHEHLTIERGKEVLIATMLQVLLVMQQYNMRLTRILGSS